MARRRRRLFTQKGIALIVVVTALALTGIIAGEFTTRTQIDQIGAVDARDQVVAEFQARSSMNLSELIIRLQQVMDSPEVQRALGSIQITDYADLFMSAFGGTEQELADQGIGGDLAKGFGGEVGSFGVSISTDDGKVNANCANGKTEFAKLTYTLIDSLYYFPAYDPLFQDPDADGWRRDRRLQTQALVDFIDADREQASAPGEPRAGGAEDYGYEGLRDPYKAKNSYLDSVDELKLVRGVDDRFWTLFGPSFTVYGGCKLSVRALSDPRIIAAVLYLTAKDKEDPVLRDPALLWYHALAVAWARQNGYAFNSLDDFVQFVKDPEGQMQATLGDLAAQGGAAAPATPPPLQIPGVPQGVDLGLELATSGENAVDKLLRPGPQRTYRVEAWGEAARNIIFNPVRRTLTAVWDMGNVNSNQRSQDAKARNGAWVYLRED